MKIYEFSNNQREITSHPLRNYSAQNYKVFSRTTRKQDYFQWGKKSKLRETSKLKF